MLPTHQELSDPRSYRVSPSDPSEVFSLSHLQGSLSRRPRILFAEDDPEMRRLVSTCLQTAGYEVVEASSGWMLLDFLMTPELYPEASGYQLVISDVRMPGPTGLELLEWMDSNPGSPPVVLITAFGSADLHARATALGAIAVFDKPFDLGELLDKVQEIVPPRLG